MKYAIRYTRSFRHYNEVDEVVFDFYDPKLEQNLIYTINTFLMDNQRAIIDLRGFNDPTFDIIAILNKVKKEHNNMAVIIEISKKSQIEAFKDNEIPFILMARDYESFYTAINLGASDIYIIEQLAFDIKNLQFAREKGVQLRMYPDIAQCSKGTKGLIPEPTTFFIRPEDVNTYAEYVDVLEIFRQDDRTSVIYEVYKQKQWLGNLKDLILDYRQDLPNTGISPHFGPSRLNCHKKCMINQCSLCVDIAELAKSFNQVGVEIIKKREKEKIPEEQKEEMIKQLKEKGKEIAEL